MNVKTGGKIFCEECFPSKEKCTECGNELFGLMAALSYYSVVGSIK